MRPLTLQISGLNSFRQPAEIDFGELVRDGLFGIFGPTGSGKSTILDAITLALYGQVRRAPNGTRGIINMSEQRCAVSFTFAAGTATERRQYTVERLLARTKAGGVETKNVRLIEFDGDTPVPRAGKTNEVREMIQEIIGIGHDDFQRAVVLPQGAFADFLHLENAQRGAVLERLFGLQELGQRLNGLLKERAEALLLRRAEVEARLEELQGFDDDALAACTDAAARAEDERDRAVTALSAAQEHHDELAKLLELIAELDALIAGASEREAEGMVLAGLRERIERAERSAQVAPALEALDGARTRHRESEERYREATRDKDAAEAALDALLVPYTTARTAYEARYEPLGDLVALLENIRRDTGELAAQKTHAEQLFAQREEHQGTFVAKEREGNEATEKLNALEAETERLRGLIAEQNIASEERERWNALSKLVERLRQRYDERDRRAADVRACLAGMEAAQAAQRTAGIAEEEATQRALAARTTLDEGRGEHTRRITERDTLRDIYAALNTTLREARRLELELAEAGRERTALDERKSRTEEALRTAAKRHVDAQSACERAAAEREAAREERDRGHRELALTVLAEHLVDGVPCPLCGALDHPDPHMVHAGASARLEALDAALAVCETRVRECEEAMRLAEREATVAETELRSLDVGITAAGARCGTLQRDLESALRSTIEHTPVEAPPATSDELEGRLEGVKKDGIAVGARCTELEEGIAGLEKTLTAAESARADAARDHARHEAEAAARRERHTELERAQAETAIKLEEEERALRKGADGRSLEEVDVVLKQIAERDRESEALNTRLRDESRRLEELRTQQAAILDELRTIERTRDSVDGQLRAVQESITARRADLDRQLEAALPPAGRARDLEHIIDERRGERNRIRESYEGMLARYNEADSAARAARKRVDDCWNDLCREERARDEADRACTDLLAGHGIMSAEEARAWMMTQEDRAAARAQAADIEERAGAARRRMAEIEERLGDRGGNRDALRDTFASAERELATAREAHAETERLLGAANESLRLTRTKNREWNEVRAQDALSAESKATVEQLGKYLRGNGFIEFLANERLGDICRRASMQLRTLSSGRFEILARPKEGFIIRDHGNGGGERAPSSLSGGETFLVSLSLALALSDTIQVGHAPLEFFFLDEGFGTLDSDLLDVVMNSLERLRSEHRAIGVISHVAQLRERIPRRLIVTPPTERTGTAVRYELA